MKQRTPNDRPEDHYETSARALLGVGSLGVVIGGSCLAFGVSAPMLDAEGFLMTGGIIAFVGVLMSAVRRDTKR